MATKKRWKTTYLALTVQSKVVGVCTYGPSRSDKFVHYGEIYSLYVDTAYQHRRIGQRLLKAGVDALEKAGFSQIFLTVLTKNYSARNFYAANSFVSTGRPEKTKTKHGIIDDMPYVYTV